jgi:hypothetical protein
MVVGCSHVTPALWGFIFAEMEYEISNEDRSALVEVLASVYIIFSYLCIFSNFRLKYFYRLFLRNAPLIFK